MSLPEVVSREGWLVARKELLVKEKELTRARDALSAERRRLPMVEIDKEYVFDGPDGKARLLDLFAGRLQLMVYHFMWRDDLAAGCPSCSSFADGIARRHLTYLRERNTRLVFVSRAPRADIERFQRRMGWLVPWYSSDGSEFNYDFHVSFDESIAPIEYNYQGKDELVRIGMGWMADSDPPFDMHGLSCFLRDGDRVYHTYSTYSRGAEMVGGPTYFLDLTALGRQEDWEEPKDRAGDAPKAGDDRIRYPDEYEI
jgi:predicted dithiol-disulfide oxidoreductase (DUF899 family)